MSPRAEYAHSARMAQERMDVLETLPRKGCNAKRHGKRCGVLVATSKSGPLGMRRLCARHVALYVEHDRMLHLIRSIPPRATLSSRA